MRFDCRECPREVGEKILTYWFCGRQKGIVGRKKSMGMPEYIAHEQKCLLAAQRHVSDGCLTCGFKINIHLSSKIHMQQSLINADKEK
jgi:hypothetical protein